MILIAGFLFPPADYVPAEQWGAALESAGWRGMCLFVLAGLLCTSIGLPRQLVAFIGGLAYGVLVGLVVSLCAALLGCFLTATVSRRFLATRVVSRYPDAIKKLDAFISHDFFLKIIVLRLQPLGTNLISNVCIGFTRAPLSVFLMASGVGYIPQMLVFTLLGSGIRVDSTSQLTLSIVLLVVSVLLGCYLFRRHRVRDS